MKSRTRSIVAALWRGVIFAMLLIASIFFGLYWHDQASEPAGANPSALPAPMELSVYAQDQSAGIEVEVSIQRDGNGVRADDCGCIGDDGIVRSYIYVIRAKPTDILVASSVDYSFGSASELPASAGHTFASRSWANTYLWSWPMTLPGEPSDAGSGTYSAGPGIGNGAERRLVGVLDLPEAYYQDRGDVVAARFPIVTEGLGGAPWVPDLGTSEELKSSDPPQSFDPTTFEAFEASAVRAVRGYASSGVDQNDPTNPTNFTDFSGGTFSEVYWEPSTLKVTNRLVGATQLLESRTPLVNTPVAAQPDGSDLVWQGSSGLGAQFSAEDRDRLSSAGRNEFLAGIALATAAAALIALVQELPRRARHDGKPQAGAFAAQSRSEETQSRSVERGSTRFEVAAAILLALLAVIRWRRLSSK